ncbi:SGNH/GDSL hydrolase family protein [Pedobacter terrae]|uniref:SGNH/GDSL hydrolase family protein n=1 Tax=Pedobacter terrae TaxID=405671 RepID=UPI002FF808BC
MVYRILFWLCLATSLCCSPKGYAQTKPLDEAKYIPYIDLEEYMQPFWKASTLIDETVMVMQQEGEYKCNLLFPPKKILSVTSTDHHIIYKPGVDWVLKNGRLEILPYSSVPFFKMADLQFATRKPDFSMQAKKANNYILFKEGLFFQNRQIAVTYKRTKQSKWLGARSFVNKNKLRRTKKLLNNHQELKICFYGNSIETGYNSSGFIGGPPYMPSWPELVSWKLQHYFKSEVKYYNPSVPGKMAKWGVEQASALVSPIKPDLVIIGFGMNDGASRVSREDFKKQISSIIKTVKSAHPLAEFILIAPMLANPLAVQDGIQSHYLEALNQLDSKDVEIIDMTGVHQELLKHKSYQDMTGNNINHPNDYLSRWYAQMICGLFIK